MEDDGEKNVSFKDWQNMAKIHCGNDFKSTAEIPGYDKNPPAKPSNVTKLPSKSDKGVGSNTQSRLSGASKLSATNKKRSSGKMLNIDPKHFVIGSSPKRDIIGGSHYSRALLVDAHLLTRGPAPTNLRYLENVDHLFFKPCKKFPPEILDFNPTDKRGIWNSGGRCVYYVGRTNYYIFKGFRSGFTYEVVDYVGTPVLTATGSQWNLGFKGKVSVMLGNGFLIGTMEQEFLGSYNIKDGQGRVVYTIQAPCYAPVVPFIMWCFQEEFEICMDDGISEIGKITRGWGDEFPDFDGDLGLEFESTDDNRVKALLLGVYFLVEFQYYKHGGNGLASFVFFVILAIGLSFVLSNGFGFYPQINSPLIPGDIHES